MPDILNDIFFIILLLIISVVLHYITGFIVYVINEDFPVFYTPATFYKLTKMNWFGCVMVYIMLFPFGFVFEIGGFIKWLFTVGREE